MSRNCQKQPFRGLGWIKNENFHASEPSEKQNLPPVSSKNGENCKFRGRNHQKSLKIANSVDGIIKKRKKPAFPTLGKVKITQKPHFPTLGKSKMPKNNVSQPWESQKRPKTAFPNLGKVKNAQKPHFPTLGKAKTPQGDSYKRRSSFCTGLESPPAPSFLLNNIK